MRRQLLLFTTNYPYGTGEPFIEPEIDALSKAFERVFIFPGSGSGPMRMVPQNVCVLPPLWGSSGSRLAFFLRHVLHWRTIQLVVEESWRAFTTYRRSHIAVLYRIWLWAMYRCAYERSAPLRHVPAMAAPHIAAAGVSVAVRYHRVDLYLHGMDTAGWIHRKAQFFPWREEVEAACKVSLYISDEGSDYFARIWPKSRASRKVVARLGARGGGELASDVKRLRPSSTEPLVVASCSSIVPVKRVPMIARFAISLARQRPVAWHHFGGGDNADVRSALAFAPATLSATLHGHIENTEVLRFYRERAPHLFVNFSTQEGVPVSIMEAMSCNIPIVATAVGGTPEAVITGKSGLLIDEDACRDPDALADRVIQAMAPGGALDSAEPRKVWKERFDARTNAEFVAQLLLSLESNRTEAEAEGRK
jgi:glycosyltransferase involved in cell wall biosynthesis